MRTDVTPLTVCPIDGKRRNGVPIRDPINSAVRRKQGPLRGRSSPNPSRQSKGLLSHQACLATSENDGLSWLHCDGLIWLHLVRPAADDLALTERGSEASEGGFESGVVRADPQGSRRRERPVAAGVDQEVPGASTDGSSGVGVGGAAGAQSA
jgi:hypothetical protein